MHRRNGAKFASDDQADDGAGTGGITLLLDAAVETRVFLPVGRIHRAPDAENGLHKCRGSARGHTIARLSKVRVNPVQEANITNYHDTLRQYLFGDEVR